MKINLNTTQKILLIISIVSFITINIFAFIIAIPTFKVKFIRDIFTGKSITVLNNNQTLKYSYGEEISFSNISDSKITFNNNILISNDILNIKLISEKEISVTRGLLYIETNTPFVINIGKTKIILPKNLKAIYNSQEKSLIIVSGNLQLNNKNAKVGSVIVWQVDNLYLKDFNPHEYSNVVLQPLISTLRFYDNLPDELKFY